jgi:Fe-Mn family superoxide dismutase
MIGRALLRNSRRVGLTTPIRKIHTVPKLFQQEVLEEKGIPGLYSPKGFTTAWTEYQKYLTDELTSLTIDSDNEARVPFHIVVNAAPKADQAHVFNFASQALNNHLFFESLTNAEFNNSQPSTRLLQRIERNFNSLEGLREEMLSAAKGMLGNGWVFLVEGTDKDLFVLPTFNAGSPYHVSRMQMFDLSGSVDADAESMMTQIEKEVERRTISHNIVLLACNVWEHAYVPDYGIAGRDEYLNAWWNAIDWHVVSKRLFK